MPPKQKKKKTGSKTKRTLQITDPVIQETSHKVRLSPFLPQNYPLFTSYQRPESSQCLFDNTYLSIIVHRPLGNLLDTPQSQKGCSQIRSFLTLRSTRIRQSGDNPAQVSQSSRSKQDRSGPRSGRESK